MLLSSLDLKVVNELNNVLRFNRPQEARLVNSNLALWKYCDHLDSDFCVWGFVILTFPDLAECSLANSSERLESVSYLPVFVEILIWINTIYKVETRVSQNILNCLRIQ
jgi:hypothetical protein